MRDDLDETVESIAFLATFSTKFLKRSQRFAKHGEARERTVERCHDLGLDQPDSGT